MIKYMFKNEERQSFIKDIHYIVLEFIVIYEVKIFLKGNCMLAKHLAVLSAIFNLAWICTVLGLRLATFLHCYFLSLRNETCLIARAGRTFLQ